MATTENPAFGAAQRPSGSRTDLEAAVSSLHASFKDGNEAESVETLERLMTAREAELQAMFDAKLDELNDVLVTKIEAATPLSAAVRSAVAHLTEAPPNYHQATVMYAVEKHDDDETTGSVLLLRRTGSLVLSVLVVLMQSMVAMGVMVGTYVPACESSDQCAQKGTYCSVGKLDRCVYCGGDVPLPRQTDLTIGGTVADYAQDPHYFGFNLTLVAEICAAPTDRLGTDGFVVGNEVLFTRAKVVSWCESCVFNDGRVDVLTVGSLVRANVAAMGPFDWIALVFATVVVALTIAGELKDIELCATAVRHDSDHIAPAWRFALSLLGGIRRWTFLPTLVMSTVIQVTVKGADALSICFNTVAVLFLCEIDNLLYAILLPERERARVEVDGRVELGEVEAEALMRSKVVHVVVLVLLVPFTVALVRGVGDTTVGSAYLGISLMILAFWVAGVTEAVLGTSSVGEALHEVGKVTWRWLLGFVGILALFTLSVLI